MTIAPTSNITDLFQRVSQTTVEAPEKNQDEKKSESTSDFDTFLRSIMGDDPAKETNEEELFAALIQERLKTHVGEEAAEAFATKLGEMRSKHTRADGYVFVEDAAKEALAALVTDETIDQETADKIRKESFTAAQLDENKEALWDGRGSAEDPTMAVSTMEAALISAQQIISKLESGELVADEAPAGETGALGTDGGAVVTPTGNGIDGDKSGFLYKPVSESNGNLVVLLPAQMAHEVEKVLIRDKEGNEVEQGVSHGYNNPDQHGEREHFRFSKPGASYPAELLIEVVMNDGSTKQYKIPDPSQRYD